MKSDWRDRVRKMIDPEKGRDMRSISVKAGMSPGWLSDTLNDNSSPKISVFLKLADALEVPAAYLLEGDERFRITVPVVGIVSGGEGWTPFESFHRDACEKATFELGDHDMIALDVRGDSMSPAYRDGDQIFCQRRFGAGIHNLMGQDCVIETAEGEHFVKILEKGSRPDLYCLRSYNPFFKVIDDVALNWAAPVVWIKRGR